MPVYESKSLALKHYLSVGSPSEDNFVIKSSVVNSDDLPEGAILVKVLVASSDPYLRGRMRPGAGFIEGESISTYVAGKVLHSKNDNWNEGDLIGASFPLESYQIVTSEKLSKIISWKLTGLIDESEISLGIGILGMPGSTAYGGLIDILKVNEGETIFVSAAAGAVGSLVGMIAKNIYNCKVIGSCGGTEKVNLVKEKYGFDEAIDYKKYPTYDELERALKNVAPEGIDMYFENVGGIHFEVAFNNLKPRGRIAVCGQISDYNDYANAKGANINPMKMIYNQTKIEGFICYDWLSHRKGNFLEDMHKWYREGKIIKQETTFHGIESWVASFQSLFEGTNLGKTVVYL